MRAGTLRHRLTIQSSTGQGTDDDGQVLRNWATVATVYGAVEPLSGRERIQSQQTEGSVTHRVRIRYLSGVSPTMRIQHRSRTLNVLSVADVGERQREMELLCTEVTS